MVEMHVIRTLVLCVKHKLLNVEVGSEDGGVDLFVNKIQVEKIEIFYRLSNNKYDLPMRPGLSAHPPPGLDRPPLVHTMLCRLFGNDKDRH